MRLVLASLALCLATSLATSADQPKAIQDATKLLEDALAKSKDAAEQEKLKEAIAALKKVGDVPPKIQNELISDIVDNALDYQGKTLTLKLKYLGGLPRTTLRNRVGDTVPPAFQGIDPKNEAKLSVGITIPAGLKVPEAVAGDELIVTFKFSGNKAMGNTAVEIRRP